MQTEFAHNWKDWLYSNRQQPQQQQQYQEQDEYIFTGLRNGTFVIT